MNVTVQKFVRRLIVVAMFVGVIGAGASCRAAPARPRRAARRRPSHAGGEASLVLPDLSTVDFRGINGRTLLMGGLVVCALGLLFGLMTFTQLKNLPVHASMLRGVGADLRDLQDLPDHAGQVHPDPLGLHRRDHRRLLRLAVADSRQADRA